MAGLIQHLGDEPLSFHSSNPRAQQSLHTLRLLLRPALFSFVNNRQPETVYCVSGCLNLLGGRWRRYQLSRFILSSWRRSRLVGRPSG